MVYRWSFCGTLAILHRCQLILMITRINSYKLLHLWLAERCYYMLVFSQCGSPYPDYRLNLNLKYQQIHQQPGARSLNAFTVCSSVFPSSCSFFPPLRLTSLFTAPGSWVPSVLQSLRPSYRHHTPCPS